ncbi:endolytic transglycosylase MltG [Acrocarpospora catenulata]|uniref:endolytic transglycosylase MltG n=1 Tax=Acrocarpospora catenulata TaxID=2836182 RepID=UPI002023A657|nr:endolytic transglycosylase MltG [Acrocarpospora catenulata]
MDSLLGGAEDEGPSRRRSRGPSRRQQGRSRKRRRRTRRKGAAASVIALVVIVGILGGGGYLAYTWVRGVMIPKDYTGQGSGEVVIEIKEGSSASDVAQTLEDEGVVASTRAFINAVDAAGKGASLQPGTYTMRRQMSAEAAVTLLDPEKRVRSSLPIPEGYRLSKIFTVLSTATGLPVDDFKQAAKSDIGLPEYAGGRLEGFAFPATYELNPNMTAGAILSRMVERFNETAVKVDLENQAKKIGFTPRDIIIIASIVQAESGSAEDMPKVARVIYNRLGLNPPMELKMDSTLMYGLNKYGIAATDAETRSNNKYNTYKFHGLPPGPISNPGDHAIEAALHPAKGDWLYFVTTDPEKGITKFTASEAEFWKFRDEFNRNHNNQ